MKAASTTRKMSVERKENESPTQAKKKKRILCHCRCIFHVREAAEAAEAATYVYGFALI